MSVTVEIRDAMLASANAKRIETEDWRDGRSVCAMARFVVNGITMSLELREYPAENKPGVVGVETLPTEDYTSDYLEAYGIHDADEEPSAYEPSAYDRIFAMREMFCQRRKDGDESVLTLEHVDAYIEARRPKALTRAQVKAAQDAALDAMAK
jgi:hypothetical protein